MKQKGEFTYMVERATKDRLGFVSVALRQIMQQSTGGLPAAPVDSYFGVPWTRTDIEGNDGVMTVRWLYEGLGEDYGSGSLKEIYEFDASFDEVPIKAHPDFKRWIAEGYGSQDAFGNVYWYPDLAMLKNQSGTGLGGAGGDGAKKRNPMLGVEAYAVMGGVWRQSYATKKLPGGMFTRTGSIVGSPPGPVPSVPKGRNWLKAPGRARFRGNAWEVTQEWMLSGLGGWNYLVYNGKTEEAGGGSSGNASGAMNAPVSL